MAKLKVPYTNQYNAVNGIFIDAINRQSRLRVPHYFEWQPPAQ